jgi:vacuolar-type H+-ATPase subunit I/STV1
MTDVVENEVVEETQVETQIEETVDAVARLKEVEAELAQKQELVKQLRKYEKSQKEAKEAALKEQNEWKTLYEESSSKLAQYEQQLKDNSITNAIERLAAKSGVKSVATLTKLIDKTKVVVNDDNSVDESSIESLIAELQKTDSILFELPNVQTPELKKAAEDVSVLNYETELRKATSQKELEAVMKKYGKLI